MCVHEVARCWKMYDITFGESFRHVKQLRIIFGEVFLEHGRVLMCVRWKWIENFPNDIIGHRTNLSGYPKDFFYGSLFWMKKKKEKK